jgi:preprotein translocase subunit SecD
MRNAGRLLSNVRLVLGSAACLVAAASVAGAQQRQGRPPGFPVELTTDRVQTTLLEIRLAETEPGRGLIAATVSGRPVYLHDTRIVTNNDAIQARVVESGTSFNVTLVLSPEGGQRLSDATAKHVGKPLAIIVNGEVVAALTVSDRIGDQAMITGDFTREQAERIVAGLRR